MFFLLCLFVFSDTDLCSRGVLPIVCLIVCDQVQQPSTPITECVQEVRQNTVMHCITYFSVTSRISNIPLCPLFHTTQSWFKAKTAATVVSSLNNYDYLSRKANSSVLTTFTRTRASPRQYCPTLNPSANKDQRLSSSHQSTNYISLLLKMAFTSDLV